GEIEIRERRRDKRIDVGPIPHRQVQEAPGQNTHEADDEQTEIGVESYEEQIPPPYLAAARGHLRGRCLYRLQWLRRLEDGLSGRPYPSVSGSTKCCGLQGGFVIEQITNIAAFGARDDRFSPLP